MTDVVGILGFTLHAAHKVYTIIESIKDSPNEIQALRDDAFQVHGFLKKVLDPSGEAEGNTKLAPPGDAECSPDTVRGKGTAASLSSGETEPSLRVM